MLRNSIYHGATPAIKSLMVSPGVSAQLLEQSKRVADAHHIVDYLTVPFSAPFFIHNDTQFQFQISEPRSSHSLTERNFTR